MKHWFEVDRLKGGSRTVSMERKITHMSEDPQFRVRMYCHRSLTVAHTSKIVGFLFRDRRPEKLNFFMNVLRKTPNQWLLTHDDEAKRNETRILLPLREEGARTSRLVDQAEERGERRQDRRRRGRGGYRRIRDPHRGQREDVPARAADFQQVQGAER